MTPSLDKSILLPPALKMPPLPHSHPPRKIDFMWRLFNAFPNTCPRLEKTQAATLRIDLRRQTPLLPPRRDFESTVDYYEAVMPLALARQRFIKYIKPNTFLRGIHNALASVLPKKLF